MKELIKQFKKLNNDSKTYSKLKCSLDKKYNYLRIINPLRQEMKTNQIFLIDKNDNIFKTANFSNRYSSGNVILKGEYISFDINKYYGELTIDKLLKLEKISKKDAEELLLSNNRKIFHKNVTLISEFIGDKNE